MARQEKRNVDFQIISDWVAPGSRVLDLGCGQGILLDYLRRTKSVNGVGVDINPRKVLGCVRRGVTVFQGDAMELMASFPEHFFDLVILSRTVEELENPKATIEEGLRVGRRLAIGFINFGYWKNRLSFALKGIRVKNEVYPEVWSNRRPSNPFSLGEFEAFARETGIQIHRRFLLRGDWESPCRMWPHLRAGYVLMELSREG